MQTEETRPKKRQRSSSESDSQKPVSAPSQAPTVNCDDEFWLMDGTVVILAGETAFRVYMGILCQHSPVIDTTFKSPQYKWDGQLDGVPIARMDDPAQDWKHLLRVLLPKSIMLEKVRDHDLQTDFPRMVSLMRLSRKYEIADVEAYALAALKKMYSNNLDSWLTIDQPIAAQWSRRGATTKPAQPPASLFYAIEAIKIARLANIPSILPAAFYHCACLGGHVVRGYTREDGSVEHLDEDDLARCIDGMRALATRVGSHVDSVLAGGPPPHPPCSRGGACRKIWKDVSEPVKQHWEIMIGSSALRGVFGQENLSRMCDQCAPWVRKSEMGKLALIWKELPSMFGIADIVGKWPAKV